MINRCAQVKPAISKHSGYRLHGRGALLPCSTTTINRIQNHQTASYVWRSSEKSPRSRVAATFVACSMDHFLHLRLMWSFYTAVVPEGLPKDALAPRSGDGQLPHSTSPFPTTWGSLTDAAQRPPQATVPALRPHQPRPSHPSASQHRSKGPHAPRTREMEKAPSPWERVVLPRAVYDPLRRYDHSQAEPQSHNPLGGVWQPPRWCVAWTFTTDTSRMKIFTLKWGSILKG